RMKNRNHYACQSCGYVSPRWIGKCPQCNSWNSFVEEAAQKESRIKTSKSPTAKAITLSSITVESDHRTPTGIAEFDRVLGGGMMSGSVVLVGGDPGIGKSTLMLQTATKLSATQSVLYVTGEESTKQIKLRAERLNGKDSELSVLAETN